MTIRLRTLAIAVLLLAGLGGATAGLVVWLGLYDISATDQHTAPVYRVLDYAMRRSVLARTGDIQVPDLADPRRVHRGAAHYREHCVQCHGAPGVAPEALALGMTPAPANLVGTARSWKPAEVFWVVKHGVKMSAMSAWQYRLSDSQIWDTVAFVVAMVGMTARDYAAATRQAAADDGQREESAMTAAAVPRGDADAGRRAVHHYLCATCHVIPGIVGAGRHVGPPLTGMGTRRWIGGVVPNTEDNMVRWLQNPQQFDPLSTMPALGLSVRDARDIAAYLATLDAVH